MRYKLFINSLFLGQSEILLENVQSVFINYQSSAKYHGYFYRASYQPLCWFVGRPTTGLMWLATGALTL